MPKIPVAILVLLALAVPGSAASGPQKTADIRSTSGGAVSFDYSIAFWSIPFGRTHFDAQFGPSGYHTQSHFETSGIVNTFWQSIIDASSTGQISSNGVTPTLYDSFYRRGAKHQRVKLTYAADRMPATTADPAYDMQKYPVTDAEKKAGLDPLGAGTSFLTGMHADATNPCGTVAAVYDGRRRYNIEFTWLRDEPVKLENGLYSGTAHLCQLHYNQIAGFKPKILKEGRAMPPAYAWVGEIRSAGAPNGHYLLPLKLWAATGYGTVTATLTQMKVENGASRG
jgi:hypothetical protein